MPYCDAATPAAAHLFAVRESPRLEVRRSEAFHSIVAKLLYIAKRARPDILTAIAFLATRVQVSNEDDFKKLKRVLSYLRGTLELPLRLAAKDMNIVETYADASFAVHPDMKGQSGAVIGLGGGAVYSKQVIKAEVSCKEFD